MPACSWRHTHMSVCDTSGRKFWASETQCKQMMDQHSGDGKVLSQLRCWKPNNGWSRLGLWNSKALSCQLCWGTLTITLHPQSRKAYLAPHLKDWPIMASSCDQLQSFKIPLHLLKKDQLWYTQLHHHRQKADILDRLSDFEKEDVASRNSCRIALTESLTVAFQGEPWALCWALFTSNTAVTDLPVAC